jgi:hypothetical protein
MPAITARRLCPQGVFLPPRIDYYAEVSSQIREVFKRFTPLVEPLSLNEAFLDVTGSEHLFGPAAEIARLSGDVLWDQDWRDAEGHADRSPIETYRLRQLRRDPSPTVRQKAEELLAILPPRRRRSPMWNAVRFHRFLSSTRQLPAAYQPSCGRVSGRVPRNPVASKKPTRSTTRPPR